MVKRDCLPLARLLQIRGFLMYVVRTYPWINPYMKGLHLTIDSWRPFRGADGFKLRGKELENALAWDLDNRSREPTPHRDIHLPPNHLLPQRQHDYLPHRQSPTQHHRRHPIPTPSFHPHLPPARLLCRHNTQDPLPRLPLQQLVH